MLFQFNCFLRAGFRAAADWLFSAFALGPPTPLMLETSQNSRIATPGMKMFSFCTGRVPRHLSRVNIGAFFSGAWSCLF
jgi:hypothetical protein